MIKENLRRMVSIGLERDSATAMRTCVHFAVCDPLVGFLHARIHFFSDCGIEHRGSHTQKFEHDVSRPQRRASPDKKKRARTQKSNTKEVNYMVPTPIVFDLLCARLCLSSIFTCSMFLLDFFFGAFYARM